VRISLPFLKANLWKGVLACLSPFVFKKFGGYGHPALGSSISSLVGTTRQNFLKTKRLRQPATLGSQYHLFFLQLPSKLYKASKLFDSDLILL